MREPPILPAATKGPSPFLGPFALAELSRQAYMPDFGGAVGAVGAVCGAVCGTYRLLALLNREYLLVLSFPLPLWADIHAAAAAAHNAVTFSSLDLCHCYCYSCSC